MRGRSIKALGRLAGADVGDAYALLLATAGRLFASLADGELWESRDHGDGWTALRLHGDPLSALLALLSARRELEMA